MPTISGRAPVLGALAALAATAVLAASLTGAAAVKDRQAHMKALGAAAKSLADQLHSGSPDKAVVKLDAAKILASADALPSWFPRGSGPEAGVKTRALPLIWTDPAAFAAAQKHLVAEAGALNTAAAGGDMAAVGAQLRPVGGACKGCHDKFRAPEKS